MLLNRFNPLTYNHIRREMDDLFRSFVGGGLSTGEWTGTEFPAINVWEDTECLHAEAEVPGLAMEDIEVLVIGDQLRLKGRRPDAGEAGANYLRRERGTGEFARTLTLPAPVNASKVEATLRDGVLTITLPKAEEARPRKIQVKTA